MVDNSEKHTSVSNLDLSRDCMLLKKGNNMPFMV